MASRRARAVAFYLKRRGRRGDEEKKTERENGTNLGRPDDPGVGWTTRSRVRALRRSTVVARSACRACTDFDKPEPSVTTIPVGAFPSTAAAVSGENVRGQ